MGSKNSQRKLFPAGHVIDARLNSFEEVEAIATQWRIRTCQLKPGIYRTLLQAIHTPQLQLARTKRTLSSHIEAEIPRNTTMLGFSVRPDCRAMFRGRPLLQEGVVFQRDSSLMDLSLTGVSDMISLSVDTTELNRRAEHLWHHSLPANTNTLAFANEGVARRTAAFCLMTICENLTPEGTEDHSRHAGSLENRILDGVLCHLDDRSSAEGTLGRHALARRAAGVLRDLCAEDLSIADLCEVTGATRRTLHLGFLEVYGLPPMVYLKALRLCRVRRELSATTDPTLRITDVAMRWGFTHLGRFAGSYRAFFGEAPSAQKARANQNHPRYLQFA